MKRAIFLCLIAAVLASPAGAQNVGGYRASGSAVQAMQAKPGVAGTASTDVSTIQGIAGMTPVLIDGSAVTQPVSGTFWQTTQPVSLASLPALPAGSAVIGHVIVDLAPSTAVTGTFWQATQPVSGSVSVSNFPASQAVTGTFWQTTQPVSLASLPALAAGSAVIGHVINDASSAVIGHVIVDTAPSTAVTGTFWQATQPVSGTFWQATQPVSGTFWQSTQPVSVASLPLPSGAMQQTGGTVTLTTMQPSGATAESCTSGNVAAGTAACTLAATAGKTTYIAGFSMTASGATAALAVNCTLTGVITGTQTYIFTFPVGVAVPATPLNVVFNPPLPASATNTTITPSCPSGGSGAAHAAMNANGYEL